MSLFIEELKESNYIGVNRIDRLTQEQYLKSAWDEMSEEEKEKHLVTRRSDFKVYLNSKYSFIALKNNEEVGMILVFEFFPKSDKLFVQYIAIDPKLQGQGIGQLLYNALIKKAKKNHIKEITSLINLDNPNSIKLHEKIGFELIDRKEAVLNLQTNTSKNV